MPISDKAFEIAQEDIPKVLEFLMNHKGKAYTITELTKELQPSNKLHFTLMIIVLIAKNQIDSKTIGKNTYCHAKFNFLSSMHYLQLL